MSDALFRIGRFAARRPWAVVGAWLAASLLVVGASAAFGAELQDSFEVPGLDSQHAVDLLAAAESDAAGLTAAIVVSPDSGTFREPAAGAALAEVSARAAALPHVLGVGETRSPNDRLALLRLQYPVLEDLGPADLGNLKALAAAAGAELPLQVELSGDLFFAFEEAETGAGEMIGLAVAAVVLLVAFGSVLAMGLPIGVALFGIALGAAAMPLLTHLIDIPSFAPQMGTMIGLGVGIDYALFLVTRHREHLAAGMSVPQAAGRAVATAGKAVVFAGGTVVIAILGLAFAGIPFMTAAGLATAVIVLLMVIASVTLLPALLGLAGERLRRGRLAAAGVSRRWRRWGEHVSRHAGGYAVGVTVVLLALTAPVLALRLGFPDDGTLPDTRTERRAYDLVAEGFGPGANGPLVIAVDISRDAGVVEPLVAAITADPGIAAVGPAQVDEAAGVAALVAYPTTAPQDDATVATIARLRGSVFPAELDGSPARAHIGGSTASFADMGDRVARRLPLFIGAVVVLSFLLLALLFRSVLVPLKAALLNLLSIGAAYGVLVAVFQWGWGKDLIGLEATVPIVSFIPLFMFAVLFGLSMDYEVFLLSRIREEYLDTGDNGAAVISGIASTARVITSAALIMISVFLGFVLGDDPTIKMVGLGLATAIFVDATVVRLVLVPATMQLLGDANWWLPRWLDRRLPRIELETEPPVAEPVVA